ncbi:MAG: hypothetical protein MJZ60_05510 [Bacteroidaceae bacterium]|nr:hypothetical protein [Bacteroidaceae bacterium]
MKKFYLYAVALCALTACGNKSEKATGEEAKQDNSTQVVEAEKPAAVEEAAPQGNDLSMPELTKKSWAVKGGVGVKNFLKAILPATDEYYAENPEAVNEFFNEEECFLTVDEKNGYLHFFQEGDGGYCMELCYWKRTDGSILVAFYDDSHSMEMVREEEFKFTKHSTLTFFIYDKEKKELVPVAAPLEVSVGKGEHICWTLPQKGKDISYKVNNADDTEIDGPTFNLKFDGMKFNK